MQKISDKDTDVPTEQVDTIRDLGILIDKKLSFKEHIRDKNQQGIQDAWSN